MKRDLSKLGLRFYRAYRLLSAQGLCDAPGGREYRRVRREWVEAGAPPAVARFIVTAANRVQARGARDNAS